MPLRPGQRFGKYQLERPLATGGMAELYLARQSGPGGFQKQVVIKRVLPHLSANPEFVQMFLDEARLASRLSHPNIVQVFDFGEAGGHYFLVMEYLAGADLDTILAALRAKGRTMPPHIAALIASAACEALDYAHACADDDGRPLRIVHRDVSPSNLFVTHQGLVKVLDFGIAQAEGKLVHTKHGVLKGKFLYMSPEQVRGRELDGRSDLFALGAVLHESLTGRPTFERDTGLATLRAIADEPAPRPSDWIAGIPPDLEGVVARALERDPDLRWPSALDMRVALDRFIAKSSSAPSSARLQAFLSGTLNDPLPPTRLSRSADTPDRAQTTVMAADAAPAGATPGCPRALSESPTVPFEASETGTKPRKPESTGPAEPLLSEDRASEEDLAAIGRSRRPRHRVLVLVALPVVALTLTLVLALSRPPAPSASATGVAIGEPQATVDPPSPAPTPSVEPEARGTPALPQAPASTPPPRSPRGAQPATATGTLDVNCVPWCRVFVDGRDLGLESPAKGIVLDEGSHAVRVVNPPSGVARELTIRVTAGATTRHVIRF